MDAPRLLLVALLVAVAAAAAGCGGDDEGAQGQLDWIDTPNVVVPPALKTDRILRGDVRNDSGEAVRLEAAKVRVYDARGRRLKASATFAAGYLHSLYPPTRGPKVLPDKELERLGRIAKIEAGDTAQITVSWRERPGGGAAARIDYGPGSLRIPPEPERRPDENY
jgi:hypothetical protein